MSSSQLKNQSCLPTMMNYFQAPTFYLQKPKISSDYIRKFGHVDPLNQLPLTKLHAFIRHASCHLARSFAEFTFFYAQGRSFEN